MLKGCIVINDVADLHKVGASVDAVITIQPIDNDTRPPTKMVLSGLYDFSLG